MGLTWSFTLTSEKLQ